MGQNELVARRKVRGLLIAIPIARTETHVEEMDLSIPGDLSTGRIHHDARIEDAVVAENRFGEGAAEEPYAVARRPFA